MIDRLVEQEAHPLAPVGFDDRVDGVEPLLGLDGIAVGEVGGHDPRSSLAAPVSRSSRLRAVGVRASYPDGRCRRAEHTNGSAAA